MPQTSISYTPRSLDITGYFKDSLSCDFRFFPRNRCIESNLIGVSTSKSISCSRKKVAVYSPIAERRLFRKMALSKEQDWKKYGICAAANVRHGADGSSFDVYSHGSGPSFTVTTIHISCQSDTYRGNDYKYGGIIIYARNAQTDWYTANGTHCKSGYLVIKRTDTSEFEELKKKWHEPGIVHGTIYRKAFGESCNDVTVVGEGFGIMNGTFEIKSGAFNLAHGDNYHDSSDLMNKDSARYVEAVVNIWKSAEPNFPRCQNYSVRELGD